MADVVEKQSLVDLLAAKWARVERHQRDLADAEAEVKRLVLAPPPSP